MKDKNAMNKDVYHMIYVEGLSFNLVNICYFKKAVESIANFGKGYLPPSYHGTRVTYLKQEVDKIEAVNLERYRKEWRRTRCTMHIDEWWLDR